MKLVEGMLTFKGDKSWSKKSQKTMLMLTMCYQPQSWSLPVSYYDKVIANKTHHKTASLWLALLSY